MFRWMSCCFLALGFTAAQDAFAADRPIVKRQTQISSPTFGLRGEFGKDGRVQTAPAQSPQRAAASQAGYSEESTQSDAKADKLKLTDWQQPVDEVSQIPPMVSECAYEWQVLPAGLMYKAYLAGEKESRMQAVWFSSKGRDGIIWETALGGHVGLLRYGNTDAINPEGWQLDLEGAALPRVDMGHQDDLEAVDFRAGFWSTWRYGPNAYKLGYYHLSSHAGDEYLIRVPTYKRLNYVRDSLVAGYTRFLTPDIQAYGEVGYAFNYEDGAEPIELQYGLQYSPMVFGLRGAPFAAINGHTRQDFGWITSVNVTAGWQWRGSATNHTYRLGIQYYTGPAMQWEFAGQKETLCGAGMWMDY